MLLHFKNELHWVHALQYSELALSLGPAKVYYKELIIDGSGHHSGGGGGGGGGGSSVHWTDFGCCMNAVA